MTLSSCSATWTKTTPPPGSSGCSEAGRKARVLLRRRPLAGTGPPRAAAGTQDPASHRAWRTPWSSLTSTSPNTPEDSTRLSWCSRWPSTPIALCRAAGAGAGRVTIGWTGGPWNYHELLRVERHSRRDQQGDRSRDPDPVRGRAAAAAAARRRPLPALARGSGGRRAPADGYRHLPAGDTPWTRGKFSIKLLQYQPSASRSSAPTSGRTGKSSPTARRGIWCAALESGARGSWP